MAHLELGERSGVTITKRVQFNGAAKGRRRIEEATPKRCHANVVKPPHAIARGEPNANH